MPNQIIPWPEPEQPADKPFPQLLRAGEVAAILQISERQVYNLINASELPVVRIRRSVRVRREALARWIEKQEHSIPNHTRAPGPR